MNRRLLAAVPTVLFAVHLAWSPARAATPLTAEEQARWAALDASALHAFTNADLAEYVQLRSKVLADEPQRPAPADEVARLARKTLGQRFRLNAVRFDLAEGDCVTFVERTIALSLSHDWPSYYRLCERLRHKDGIVEYKNRNFATLGDWLPNNAWLLQDITGEIGPPGARPARSFTHFVRPKVFEERPAAPGSKFTRITFKGSDYSSGVKEARTELCIPRDRVPDVLRDLQSGDVFLVIRGVPENPGCDHMGLIVVGTDGVVSVLHCAPPEVRQEPLATFLRRCFWVNGLKFLRLRDGARELVDAELSRLAESVQPPEPSTEDARVQALREARAKPSTPGQ